MAETKTYSPQEVIAKLAETVKERLAKFEGQVQELKARELQPREGKLAKHELCPLCGGPDRNGVCDCLTLRKNAAQGYSTPGSGTPDAGLSQMGGGGAMQMAEKKLKKDYGAGLSDVNSLSKKAPPGEEKLVHKLKDEYGHDEEGKRKAFATAWAIKNGTVKKGEPPMMEKHMPSSSASALAPKAPAPATPMHQVNAELGGAKSVFGSSPALGAGARPMMTPKPFKIHTAGRVGNPVRAVSGEIANAKAEKEIAQTQAACDESMPGTKMPKAGKKIEAKGSGGQVLKKDEPALKGKGVGGKQPVGKGGGDAAKVAGAKKGGAKKAAPVAAAPAKAPSRFAPAAGAAPAKMDALKAAGHAEVRRMGGAPPIGAPGKLPAPPAGTKPVPGHESYDVDVSDLSAPAAAPAKGPAAAMSARLKSPAAQARGAMGAPMVDSKTAAIRHAAGQGTMGAAADLRADKLAGGVGFLNRLIAKFHGPTRVAQASPINGDVNPDGSSRPPVQSKRFHGALPLRRSEKPVAMNKGELALSKMGKCAMCKSGEHAGMCKGLMTSNHSRTMLAVKKSR